MGQREGLRHAEADAKLVAKLIVVAGQVASRATRAGAVEARTITTIFGDTTTDVTGLGQVLVGLATDDKIFATCRRACFVSSGLRVCFVVPLGLRHGLGNLQQTRFHFCLPPSLSSTSTIDLMPHRPYNVFTSRKVVYCGKRLAARFRGEPKRAACAHVLPCKSMA